MNEAGAGARSFQLAFIVDKCFYGSRISTAGSQEQAIAWPDDRPLQSLEEDVNLPRVLHSLRLPVQIQHGQARRQVQSLRQTERGGKHGVRCSNRSEDP